MAKLNSGTRIYGNVTIDTFATATGNVTGGNILTAGLISSTGNIVTGTNGFIGIGTTTPDTELNILANPQTVSYTIAGNSTTSGTDLHISGADGAQTRITQDSFGATSYVAFTGRTARGTAAAPTQTQSGDTLVQFTGRGFSNGTLQFGNASTGRLDMVAAEAFTDTSRATNVQIFTTATAAITPTAIATFSSAAGLSVAGNITGGNVLGGANVNATTHTGTTVSVTGNITGAFFVGNGSALTGITASGGASIINGTSNVVAAASGNVTVAVAGTNPVTTFASTGVYVPGLVSVTGNITGGNVLGGANVNATTHTGTTVSVTGNITGGGHVGTIYTNSIINTGANATGNIGSSTLYFNTVFAKATSAQYADLAEMYSSDSAYAPGTVVEFGGDTEITITTQTHSTQVAGIVSTNPSYLMNSTLDCEHAVEVALVGRVPCQVIGRIRKGDRLVASHIPGTAQVLDTNMYQPGCIVGKALENYDSDHPGTIEVAVGRI